MTKVTCPVCKSSVERDDIVGEYRPIELDEFGVPYACAVHDGYGLPVVTDGRWNVELDGKPVERCVAYDRHAGKVWFYAAYPDGSPVIQDDGFVVEQACGEVTVTGMPKK